VTQEAARDQLRELLDIVVASVDDPRLTGRDVAGRAYLSRFHFDRLIAAATGEAPGALRRRLLLERSAYQLRHHDVPVLKVALAAGYGSAEAFTHAFSRAFGMSPTRHRSFAGRSELPAPNGIHFHPPGGLRLPAPRRRHAMDVLNLMLEHDSWLIGELLDRSARLDDATLDTRVLSGADSATLRDLLTHLVWQKERWAAAIDGRQVADPAEHESIAALQRRHAESAPRFLGLAGKALAEGGADDTFIDATCDPPRSFTIGGMAAHVLTFAAYERALVLRALSEAGVSDLGLGDPSSFVAQGGPG
jgi:AraC family transcriptional regulator